MFCYYLKPNTIFLVASCRTLCSGHFAFVIHLQSVRSDQKDNPRQPNTSEAQETHHNAALHLPQARIGVPSTVVVVLPLDLDIAVALQCLQQLLP